MTGTTRRWILLATAALTIAVVSGCGSKTTEQSPPAAVRSSGTNDAGPFRIAIRNRPETPSVGDNTLIVTVQDSLGRAVDGAHLETQVVMPAMGAMPRMESRGIVREASPGEYESKYGIPMAGEWEVVVRIRHTMGVAEADYRLSNSLKGLTFVGGTPSARAAASSSVPSSDETGAVRIDPARRQAIGVRTQTVQLKPLATTIRASGRVTYDETRRAEVSMKYSGWVRDLRVDYTGKPVRAGQVLFTAYSPELIAAQQEYLTTLGQGGTAPADADLAAAARERLLRWDLSPSLIDEIARTGKPVEAIPVRAKTSGVVVEKSIVQGSAFTSGMSLYKIASVNPVWVVASVYPYELPFVRMGMTAVVLSPFLPEHTRGGRVSYIDPYLDPDTRTAQVRVVVPNPRGELKPDMFVDVALSASLGNRLSVPESAVLYSGDRRIVFVDLGDGRFAPREVTLGAKAGDDYEVLGGLKAGEMVVTSGNFLIAAESRLKSAVQKW